MARPSRRFGAYHRYDREQPTVSPRSFKPDEPDQLIIESISPELSPTLHDNSGETTAHTSAGDNTGETAINRLTPLEKDFHRNCGKSCGKARIQGYKFLKNLDF